MVWEAWVDPAQAAHWWGPRGFTITTHSKDLRPGGHWRYTMHGPDGVDSETAPNYWQAVKQKSLVSESDGKTTMDMTMALESPEAAEQTRKFVKKAGGESTWDRLAEFIEKRAN